MDIYGFEKPETRWLSNFYPVNIEIGCHHWPSSEHAYQAAKTLDYDERMAIKAARTPGQAKKLGRKVTMRPDWDKIKRHEMKCILRLKFSLPGLKELLLQTGDGYLEETNHWGDTYWGVCNGVGQNNLGHVLMEIREELRNESNTNIHNNQSN
jgi:ribA/ribD-fused uncharacterized protein